MSFPMRRLSVFRVLCSAMAAVALFAAAPARAEEDPYAVPKDAPPEALLRFMEKVQSQFALTRSEQKRQVRALEEASTALLAAKGVSEEMAALGVRTKFAAFEALDVLGEEQALEKSAAFLKSLKDDKRPAVALIVREESLKARANGAKDLTAEERRKLLGEVVEHVGKTSLGGDALQFAVTVASGFEEIDAPLAAEAYERLAALFARSQDDDVKEYVSRFGGIARRLRLPGNPVEIKGTTLDGKPFDLKELSGKVVLVDFWATWCLPCIAEMSNIRKSYDRYHARGFEVVGINLDDSRADLDEFLKDTRVPWVNLFGTDRKTRGFDHPMAVRYGVMGIPTTLLVNQKGEVVALDVRGEQLGELLEKLLPPAEQAPKSKPAKE